MTSTHGTRRRVFLLGVICAATLMTVIDETIVTVALPDIRSELNFTAAGLPWVVNAYLIGFGGVLLFAGRVGDLVGRGRVLLSGMALFTAASMLCGLAMSPAWLIVARFVQGIGAAFAVAVALGMIAALFVEPGERDRAMGAYAFMGAVGASSGYIIGGIITTSLDWRWVFFVNVPIGVVVVVAGLRTFPGENPPGLRGGLDWQGASMLVVGLMCLVGALASQNPVAGAAALVLLAGFVVRQRFAASPTLPLEVLAARGLGAVNIAFACFVGAMFTFQFLTTLYLQEVLGFTPLLAGIGIVPIAAGIAVGSMGVYPRVAARFGVRAALIVGLGSVVIGLFLLIRVRPDGSYTSDLLPTVVLFAVGGGLALPAIMSAAMADVAPAHTGVASGLINTSQQAGGAIGLAGLTAVAAAVTASSTSAGAPESVALVDGFRVAWGVAGGLASVALIIVVIAVRVGPAAGAGGSADVASSLRRPRRDRPRGTRPAGEPPAGEQHHEGGRGEDQRPVVCCRGDLPDTP